MRPLLISRLLLSILLAVADGAAPCDVSLIKFKGTKEFTYGKGTLNCKSGKEIVHNNKQYNELKCWVFKKKGDKQGWYAGITQLTKLSTDEINIECAPIACHEGLVSFDNVAHVDRTYIKPGLLKGLTCKAPLQMDVGGSKLYAKLTCDTKKGWQDPNDQNRNNPEDNNEPVKVKEATDIFNVKCLSKDKSPCPFKQTSGAFMSGQTLVCPNRPGKKKLYHNISAIVYNEVKYGSLTCDRKEWKDMEGKKLAPATTELDISCVQYCNSVDSTVYALIADRGAREMSCVPEDGLFNGPTRVKGDKLVCSMQEGWMENGEKLPSDYAKELPLSCRAACGNYMKPNPTYPTEWIPGLSDDADEFEQDNWKSVQFKCVHANGKIKAIDDPKNVIKFNDQFVWPHVNCDDTKGYTDSAGNKLAEAHDAVKIVCDECEHCKPTTTTTTTAVAPITKTTITTNTTAAPLSQPCDICPSFSAIMMKCEDCNNKADAIKFVNTEDKCEARTPSNDDIVFQTENKQTIKGSLYCNKTEKIWKTKEGDPVGKFAALKDEPKAAEAGSKMGIIVGAVMGAIVVFLIGFVVVAKVVQKRKDNKAASESKSKSKSKIKSAAEGQTKKEKLGNNDGVLDQVPDGTPSTLRL